MLLTACHGIVTGLCVYVCVRFHYRLRDWERQSCMAPETLVSGVAHKPLRPSGDRGSRVALLASVRTVTLAQTHTPSLSRHLHVPRVLDFTCDTSARPQLVCRRARTAASRGFPCGLRTSFRCMARKGARLAAPSRRLFGCAQVRPARKPAPPRMVHCPPTHGPLPPSTHGPRRHTPVRLVDCHAA